MRRVPYEQSDIIELIKQNCADWSGIDEELLWVTLEPRKGRLVGVVTRKDNEEFSLTFVEK